MKFHLLTLSSFLPASLAFSPSTLATRTSNMMELFAEGGAPQYDKVDSVLSQVDIVGEGSAMLRIETQDDAAALDYKPGHVLALEIQGVQDDISSVKTKEDADNNEGWMRGPYTVSRATDTSFDVLIKIVGDKSKAFSEAKPGTPVKFGGKFKVPIIDGIIKDETKRVVLISTGVGCGPCIGAIEEALKDESFPPIEFFPSYKKASEVVLADHLDSLGIKWKPIITSEIGRLSASQENMAHIAPSTKDSLTLNDTHYHLIGNGQMVNEWKEGLKKAGVPEDKVTVEAYFNHRATSDEERIDTIASAVAASCCSTVS